MSPSPRELLHRLFVYIEEQLKDIDPRAFQIGKSTLPRLFPKDLANLPGVSFDVQEEGDHVWMRVDRLEEIAPPEPHFVKYGRVFRVDTDPNGKPPELDEGALASCIQRAKMEAPDSERTELEERIRSEAEVALVAYSNQWQEWAAREKPRRKTISLYSDLFALRHQLHAEQTANPVEFVWGLGVATWKLSYEGKPFDFHYPLLTQPLEISLDTESMSLEVRPRATEPGCEMDGFVACGTHGASECEKAMLEHLSQHKDTPVTLGAR